MTLICLIFAENGLSISISEINFRNIQVFFYNVYNKLGYGFLENEYERSRINELIKQGMKTESQKAIKVFNNNEVLGEYFVDLVVEDSVILEYKAADSLCEGHEIQLFYYLIATKNEVCLLLNFG